MAAPHVSGVAALMLSVNSSLSPSEVKDIIIKSTDKVGGYNYVNGRCDEMGYGRLNAFKALFRTVGYGNIKTDVTWHNDIEFTGNVVIDSSFTMTIDNDVIVKIADGYKIEVSKGGTLKVGSGAKFTKASGGTYWSGIDIKNGGTLETTGDFTIEYADCGIDIFSGSILKNGNNTITIMNCRQAGLWGDNTTTPIRNILCDNTSSQSYQNGAISVSGSTSAPKISRVTVRNSWLGLKIGTSVNNPSACVDSSHIQPNISHAITVISGCYVDLNGYNISIVQAGILPLIIPTAPASMRIITGGVLHRRTGTI
jgi:hypothetical protein